MGSSTRIFWLYLLLIVCVICQPAGGETNTYVFLTEQSKVVQTGGFAGVHETYAIEGQFQLTVDFDAGTALFSQVDANLVDESPFLPTKSLGELFNMAELLGTVVDDTTIDFVGKTADGMESTILITLTFRDDSAHLTGRTVPPPNSADFFIFELDALVWKKYGGGTGEANGPYLINTAEQMNSIGLHEKDWDKHFKLMVDIDLSAYTGTDFNIIGYWVGWGSPDNKPFAGVFDGSGKKILNFIYTSTGRNRIGLFGYVDGKNAHIRNLGLIDPNIDARRDVGSLVGWLREGTILNCYADGGSVAGNSNVGGLVGLQDYGAITNCYATVSVSGDTSAGGLVGYNNWWCRISDCYSRGSVSGKEYIGGIVGLNRGTIANCYVQGGSVLGSNTVGGFVGSNGWPHLPIARPYPPADITNCYSTGSVSGNNHAGGLVGRQGYGRVTASFWDIETSGLTTSEGGTGKTTAEMQVESTFTDAGWDFVDETANGTEDIWSICEGTNYPRLVWQIPAGDFVCPDGITIDDFLFFIEHWRDDNCDSGNDYCQGTDLDFSGTVDEADLEIFLENWLADIRSD
jgi:hypothetical protein